MSGMMVKLRRDVPPSVSIARELGCEPKAKDKIDWIAAKKFLSRNQSA